MRAARPAAALVAALAFALAPWVEPQTEAAPAADQPLIAFATDRDGNSEIYVMNPDGSQQRRLTRHGASDTGPSWAPDARRLVFASNRSGVWALWKMDADGANLQQITRGPADYDPEWSPDGERVAFERLVGRDREVFVVNQDGTDLRNVSSTAGADIDPRWAPNGGQIVFTHQLAPTRFGLALVDPDVPGRLRQETDGPADFHPSFSPDGGTIVFSRRQGRSVDVYRKELGSPTAERMTSGRAREDSPAWAPDGSTVVVEVLQNDQFDLYAVDPGGGRPPQNLSECLPGDDLAASWQPFATGNVFRSLLASARALAGSCTWTGTPNADVKTTGSGPQTLCGAGGNDRLHAGAGVDGVKGNAGNDWLWGDGGNDTIKALEDPPRRDCLYGGPGADEAYVDAGLDNVNCSPAPDVIETIY
jgi:Tol biopolymer transport system component